MVLKGGGQQAWEGRGQWVGPSSYWLQDDDASSAGERAVAAVEGSQCWEDGQSAQDSDSTGCSVQSGTGMPCSSNLQEGEEKL